MIHLERIFLGGIGIFALVIVLGFVGLFVSNLIGTAEDFLVLCVVLGVVYAVGYLIQVFA